MLCAHLDYQTTFWVASFGPCHVITPNGSEKWAIVSDEPVGRHTFDEYGLRFDIEENFMDDKSGGFNLEDCRLEDSMAISRLCRILAIATVYLVSTGMTVVTLGLRPVVDTHWRRGLSYLQNRFGGRCKHALANQLETHYFAVVATQSRSGTGHCLLKQFHRPPFELHSLGVVMILSKVLNIKSVSQSAAKNKKQHFLHFIFSQVGC